MSASAQRSSATDSRYRRLIDHDLRSWPEALQQSQHRAASQSDAACSRSEFFTGEMNEHGAAAARNARPGIVIDLDDEIVEMIVAHQPVAGFAGSARDRLVVMPVGRVFRPGIGMRNRANRQMRSRAGIPVGPPPQPDRMEDTSRCAAIAFELVGLDSAAPQRDRQGMRSGSKPALGWPAGGGMNGNHG